MRGYRSDTYGEGFADIYDDWYHDVSDVGATVARIAELAGAGRVLELGVGTGRLAIPLAQAGVDIVGIDTSRSMVNRLLAKPGSEAVGLAVADMIDLPFAAGRFSLAFAAFNTFFNLTTPLAHQQCATRLSEVICPGGLFVVEGFLPPPDGLTDGGTSVRSVTLDTAVLTVSRHDEGNQQIHGQHIEISESGIRMRPWMLRYLTPGQLDDLFTTAGFALQSRCGGWNDESFDPAGDAHVSIYRLATEGAGTRS